MAEFADGPWKLLHCPHTISSFIDKAIHAFKSDVNTGTNGLLYGEYTARTVKKVHSRPISIADALLATAPTPTPTEFSVSEWLEDVRSEAQWKLQVVIIMLLFVSPELRQVLAYNSPKMVCDMWLNTIEDRVSRKLFGGFNAEGHTSHPAQTALQLVCTEIMDLKTAYAHQ